MRLGCILWSLLFAANGLYSQTCFIPNNGQIHNQNGLKNTSVQYVNYGDNVNFHLTNGGFNYELVRRFHDDSFEFYRADVAIRFQGKLNTNLEWEGKSTAQKWFNFYNDLGSFENIEGFNSVEGEIGKEAKVEFSSSREALVKYDIHCKVKDLPSLEFVFDGPDFVEVDGSRLTLKFDNFEFVDEVTKSYTMDGQEIRVVWEVINEHTVGFRLLDKLDPETRITIDPSVSLKWATYYGDNSNEQGYGTASTQDGNAVFCGRISSRSMATSGTHQSTIGGSDDAFLVKMHKEGGSNSRLWATYFGGSSVDYAHDVFVSSTNAILLTGRTSSSNAIAKNARYKSSRGGKLDAFFAKFTDSGTLDWANYLGGSEDDVGLGIATDSSQNVLVVGYTESSSGIASRASSTYLVQQWSRGGNKDGFLGKFDKDGRRLFVTYFGGSGTDISNSVICTLKDTIVFVGETNSSSITSSSTSLSGRTDGFITKLDPNGRLSRFIYVGDTLDDVINKVRYFNPNLFVVGTTNSTSNISLNGHQNTLNKGSSAISTNTDAFLLKYSSSFKKIWGTYYGGDDYEWGNDLATDIKGYLYLLGTTKSYNSNGSVNEIIATKDAFIEYLQGGTDAFLVKFDQKGKRIFSTYFGSLGNDYGNGLSHGRYGDVYICGETNSNRNLVFLPYQSTYGGSVDAFFADLYYCKLKAFLNADSVCLGEALSLSFADSSVYKDTSSNPKWGRSYNNYDFTWYRPGDTMGEKTTASVFKVTQIGYSDTGVYTVVASDSFGCVDTTEIRITSDNIYSPPDVDISSAQSVCQWDTLWLTSKVNGSARRYAYNWYKNGVNLSKKDKSFIYPAVRGKHDGEYVLTVRDSADKYGCYRRDTIEINIGSIDVVDSFTFVCPGDTVKLFSFIGDPSRIDTAYWAGPNNFLSATLDTSVVISDSSFLGDYLLYVADSNGCKDTFELEVLFKSIQTPSLTYDEHYCENDSIKVSLSVSGGNANSKFSWSGPNSYSDTSSVLWFIADTSLNGRYNVEIRSGLYCPLDTSLNLYVTNNPKAELNYDSLLCVGDSLLIEYSNYIGTPLRDFYYLIPEGDQMRINPYKITSRLRDSGTYVWTMIDTLSCRYDSTFKIHVVPYQTATLTYEDHYCEDDSIKVSLSVSGGNANSKFSWSGPRSYSDTSSELGFVADTSLNGRYKVEIRSDLYCPLDTTLDLYVTNNPKAELNYDSVLCVGDTLTIEYSNYVGSQLWLSTFITPKNDSILVNPYKVKSYITDSGEYHWSLVDTFACRYDSIFKVHIVPYQTATLTYEDHYCEDDSIKVSLSVSGGNANSKFSWSGPRSYSDTSSELEFVADTSLNGRYKVEIRSDLYCPLDTTLDLYVTNNPKAELNYDSVLCVGDTLTIEYSNYVGSQLWLSTFITPKNDSILVNPYRVKSYITDSGEYHWSLVDTFACRYDSIFKVRVVPYQTATLTYEDHYCEDDSIKVSLSVSGGNANSKFSWSGPRSYSDTSSELGFVADTSLNGRYKVEIRSDLYCPLDTTLDLYVTNNPRARLLYDSVFCLLDTLNLEYVNYVGSSFSNSQIISPTGDTIRSNPFSKVVNLADSGLYHWSLVDTFGCQSEKDFVIDVNPNPVADFEISSSFCANDVVVFKNASGGRKLNYTWHFDSTSSVLSSKNSGPLTIKYSDTGVKNVRLIASSSDACSHDTTKSFLIHDYPRAKISSSSDTICFRGNKIDFVDSSTYAGRSRIVKSIWFYDSATTKANRDTAIGSGPITIEYSSLGKKDIKLIVLDGNGCSDTTESDVFVLNHPKARIHHADTNLCKLSNLFLLTDTSSKTDLSVSKWNWDFDANHNPKQSSKDTSWSKGSHKIKYSDTGEYRINLVISDLFGCNDTASVTVYVHSEPISMTSRFDSTGCVNKTRFDISNQSTIDGKAIRNQKWYLNGVFRTADTLFSFIPKQRGPLLGQLVNTTIYGCADTTDFTLLVDTLPDLLIESDTQCISGNLFRFENVANNYSQKISKYYWSFGNGDTDSTTINQAQKSYDSIGVYTVTLHAVTPFGCRDTTQQDIIIGKDPLAGIAIIQDLICHNTASAELQAYGLSGNQPFRYYWYGDTNLTDTRIKGRGAGSHFVIVKDRFNCFDTAELLLIQPDSLRMELNSSSVLCSGGNTGSASAFVDGGVTPYAYKWNIPRAQYVDTLEGLLVGTYNVTVTDQKGCVIRDSIKVFEPDSLKISIQLEQLVLCSGDKNAILDAVSKGGVKPYQYSINFNSYVSNGTFDSLGAGIYSIRIIDSNGCKNEDTITVMQPLPLSSTVTIDSLVCFGDSTASIDAVVKGGNLPYLYTWEHEGRYIGGDSFIDNLPTNEYLFKVKDRYGCALERRVKVSSPLPFQGKYEYERNVCEGSQTKFVSFNAPDRTIWTKGLNNYRLDSLVFQDFSYSDTGYYMLRMYNESGCLFKDSFRVDVFPGSVVSLDTVVCEGTPYKLQALNSISTSWVGPNNDIFNGSVVFKQEAELSDSGQYFAFTQSPYGCKDSFIVNLDVRKLPWLSLSPYEDKIYCEGDRLNLLFRSSEPVENIWYGPQNNKLQENTDAHLIENLTLEDEGTYTVTVKTAIGCIAQVDTVVRVGEIPEANLRIGPNECIMANTTPLQFVNVSNDYFIEKLYLNDSLFSSQLPFSAIPKRREDLDIKLVIVNSEGCSDSAEYTLPIQSEPEVYVPNSFTPNGDLTNPLFLPYMNESISQFKLSIYNRWGEKVFEQEGDNLMNNIQGWDGTFGGDICTEGVYIYILQYSTNCKEKDFVYPLTKKGWLYLLR